MYLNITISSKNNNSLKSFLKVFKTLGQSNWLKLNKTLIVFQKKRLKKVFTILKSPHVYKTAQEQFESILFAKIVKVQTFQVLKTLIMLKKIQTISFADIQIKITCIINTNSKKEIFVNYLIPKRIRIVSIRVPARNVIKSTGLYLLITNLYGKCRFTNRLNSSVGRARD
jgi:ribosomal protein S10